MNSTDDTARRDDQHGASTNLGAPSDQDLSIAAPSDQDLLIATPTDLSRTNLSAPSDQDLSIAAPSDQDLAQEADQSDIGSSDARSIEVPAEY